LLKRQNKDAGFKKLSLVIVNIIVSARIEGSIDIETLFERLDNVSYAPEIFPGLIYRRLNRKPTIIMFASGKISSHGSRSIKQATEAILDTLEEIDKIGCVFRSSKIEWMRIENMVGRADIFKEIDLEKLYSQLLGSVYEPGQFPALIYKPLRNSVTCLVFSTGKIVVVGAKSEEQLQEAFQTIKGLIYEAKCGYPILPIPI
jgi:transcription initiation factor TFIID TATA-box-binding protein